ncbi:MAG: hypothetical protein IT335_07180 [Thermomicrobiales bacterium]|nr:hypothetical protein [Thermomicrobiales bacterium]
MSTTEWFLLAMVLVVPLIVATGVTLWTLEQALKRNKKYRREQEEAKAEKDARRKARQELGS